jgi:hypothetical protein
MKANALLTLALLLSTPLALLTRQEQQDSKQEEDTDELSRNAVTRFFQEQGEQLAEGVEGSWMLLDYLDPQEPALAGAATGFATFHDGFLTFILTIDAFETRIFRLRERLIVLSGAYRYRFDEQAFLQISSVLSFTNETDNRDLVRERPGALYEYYAMLDDGILELRDPEGIVMTFRRVTAGDFPERDIRALEALRSGTQQWEEIDPGR